MTSCIPKKEIIINNSLDSLSSLSLLRESSVFFYSRNIGSYYYKDTVKMSTRDGQRFWLSGEIKLRKNGQIKWNKSRLSRIVFKDNTDKSNNYEITDHWQFNFSLNTLVKSSPHSYLKLLLRKGFALRGGDGKDIIDLSSSSITKKNEWLSISGGPGADLIIGSGNDDRLAASTSRNICDFGSGTNLDQTIKDILTGKGGNDTFFADNGTRITDIEVGEVIHIFNHNSNNLSDISHKEPSFRHKPNRTIIRLGDLKIITNPARFDFSYKFYTSEYRMCKTDSQGTICDMGWIPGEPEGYSFTATATTSANV